jgi:hypothetical protein
LKARKESRIYERKELNREVEEESSIEEGNADLSSDVECFTEDSPNINESSVN